MTAVCSIESIDSFGSWVAENRRFLLDIAPEEAAEELYAKLKRTNEALGVEVSIEPNKYLSSRLVEQQAGSF